MATPSFYGGSKTIQKTLFDCAKQVSGPSMSLTQTVSTTASVVENRMPSRCDENLRVHRLIGSK